jgi:hypothetical protein
MNGYTNLKQQRLKCLHDIILTACCFILFHEEILTLYMSRTIFKPPDNESWKKINGWQGWGMLNKWLAGMGDVEKFGLPCSSKHVLWNAIYISSVYYEICHCFFFSFHK